DGRDTSILDIARPSARERFEAMRSSHAIEPRRLFQKHQCGWMVLHTDDDPVELLGRELRVLVGNPNR
ncbi:MAG: hypothetical protein R3212_13955, partial [Xanthomonadales bacterium]|nr:hypothetical protein [Xanthomonadales bacterium]